MKQIKEFYNIYKKIIFIVLAVFVFLLLCFFIYKLFFYDKVDASIYIKDNLDNELDNKNVLEEPNTSYCVVDIKGRVHNPGVYSMSCDERIIDVINKSGGLLNDSNTSSINLSMKLKDEMVIIVYSDKEIKDFTNVLKKEKIINQSCNDTTIIKNDACIKKDDVSSDDNNDSLISINTASLEELMTLPSIGQSKANAIIKYREENGLFENIDDIKEVSGIGDSLFEKIKDYIKL